ncbi:MAG: protein kinase domain-containing protein [Pyrinomonadaceae bacterium]
MKECSKCRHCYDDSYTICPIDDKPLVNSITCNVIISGRYMLEQRLGKGGMGIVFKAKHKFLKSYHAIKLILPSLVEDDDSLLIRFKQEAILAASIDHPNVIRVTDFGVEDETMPYLVMEFVDGSPLSAHLIKNQRLTPERAFELFQPIALGVAEAHRRGIVHRDLKPQNIMVVKGLPLKKAIKVLDFGLAKIKSTELFGSMIQAETMSVIGSPPYMSPEQWENNEVDHRTDIYGLGVILYQMLTGNLPFQGDSVPSIMYQHLTVQMPSFATYGVSLSSQLEAVVGRALQKERNDRPETVEEMLEEFEEALATIDVPLTINVPIEQLKPYKPSAKDEQTRPLSETQKEKLYSYLDSSADPGLIVDEQLAQEFLEAQNRVEEAKEQVDEADKLVREFAEAQKLAQQAQQNALQAKYRIEADVRRRVEAEMENKQAFEQQARQKAESERLAQEAVARKQAEERANYLAQAALEAQQIAEAERKKAENEARQRELAESVRRRAEIASVQLAGQVADAKKKYEEAKQQADYEAGLRIAAEGKRQKIESELQAIAEHETELRKSAEIEAQKQIQEQASRYERDAFVAQQRVEEARQLAELETRKREQAEAAKLRAEEEARRLAEEINRVQRHIQEIQQHSNKETSDSSQQHSSSGSFARPDSPLSDYGSPPDSSLNFGEAKISVNNLGEVPSPTIQTVFDSQRGTVEIQTPRNSNENFTGVLNTASIPKRKISLPIILTSVFALFLAAAASGYGFYYLFIKKSENSQPIVVSQTNDNTNTQPIGTSPDAKTEMVLIKGGSFQMGRNDVPKDDLDWGSEFPAHPVKVDSFYISKTETSNEEYVKFVQATGHSAPQNWDKGKLPNGQEKFPVTSVSLADAKDYAEWYSKQEKKICRLPKEEEWEFAARNGTQQTSFPWGDNWNADFTNIATTKISEAGIYPDETLVGGIKDMMGNVIEWTSSKYSLYPGHPLQLVPRSEELFVARGNSFGESPSKLKNATWMLTRRWSLPADVKALYIGFRLVCQP